MRENIKIYRTVKWREDEHNYETCNTWIIYLKWCAWKRPHIPSVGREGTIRFIVRTREPALDYTVYPVIGKSTLESIGTGSCQKVTFKGRTKMTFSKWRHQLGTAELEIWPETDSKELAQMGDVYAKCTLDPTVDDQDIINLLRKITGTLLRHRLERTRANTVFIDYWEEMVTTGELMIGMNKKAEDHKPISL